MNPLFRRHDNAVQGRHLRASQKIEKNQLVFVERPLLALQSLPNAHSGTLVCRHCRAFCGGPDLALAVASGRINRAQAYQHWKELQEQQRQQQQQDEDVSSHCLVSCRHNCGELYCSVQCEQDSWECGGHALLCTGRLPESNEEDNNGDDANKNKMHPLLEFKIHAVQNNEIFLMVADLIATVLSQRCRQLQHYQQQSSGDCVDVQEENNDEDSKQQRLLEPYLDFTLVPWWTVVATELMASPMGFAEASELERTLKRLCEESSNLLRRALLDTIVVEEESSSLFLQQALEDFPELCTADFFGQVIGSFEQNAIGIRRRHPLCRDVFSRELRKRHRMDLIHCMEHAGMIGDDDDDGDNNDRDEAKTKDMENEMMHPSKEVDDDVFPAMAENDQLLALNQNREDEEWDYTDDELAAFLAGLELDESAGGEICRRDADETSESQEEMDAPGDDLDALFAPLDGTAMYSIACKMNHSCNPNVVVLYKTHGWGSEHPLVVHCVALRDIDEGEELCISYIQSDDPLDARRKAIASYGFTCRCEKCKAECNEGGSPPQLDHEVDNDDLFGEEEEEVERVEELGTDNGPIQMAELDDGHVDDSGEQSLKDRLATLNRSFNLSCGGTVPLKALALASNFVLQVGTTAAEDIRRESNAFSESLQSALNAVRERDFVRCKTIGSLLEKRLFLLLQQNGSWPRIAFREAHGCFAVVAAVGYAHEGSFISAQHMLDKACILGFPRERVRDFFDYVEYHAEHTCRGPCPPALYCVIQDYSMPELVALLTQEALSMPIRHPVEEASLPMERDTFNSEYVSQSNPVVFRKFAREWPAGVKWRHFHRLVSEHGHRLVPIEVGSMMESSMKERLVTFGQFVTLHLAPSCQKDCWRIADVSNHSSEIAYLAQHPLLDQIPHLRNDVDQSPLLCGENGPRHVNVWMGTGGTRTPLHFDTYDNLFVQIVGAKYVRIYGVEETKNLYVITGGGKSSKHCLQGNMSEVDCEMEDFEGKHPLARNARFVEVLMLPGDCLFIPARAWHYVRGLSTSISVNYWF